MTTVSCTCQRQSYVIYSKRDFIINFSILWYNNVTWYNTCTY